MNSYVTNRASATCLAMTLFAISTGPLLAADSLNVLGWCDIDDPKILRPFEEANDVVVNIKAHEDPGVAHNLILQSDPGDWDILHTDVTFVAIHVDGGVLEPLDNDFDWDSIVPEVQARDLQEIDGTLYTVPNKYGWNILSYNNENISDAEAKSFDFLWDEKNKGKIAVVDLYFSIIENVAISLGIPPAELNESHIPQIRERLFALKENVAVVGGISTVMASLASGDVDAIFGGGELTSALSLENPAITWTVPDEGGLYWVTSMGIVKGTKNRELAEAFIDYIMTPEAQGLLATSGCYWGQPTRPDAILSDEQAAVLKTAESREFLKKGHITYFYDQELDQKLIDLWAEFKQQ